jgi:hypothetical protein
MAGQLIKMAATEVLAAARGISLGHHQHLEELRSLVKEMTVAPQSRLTP